MSETVPVAGGESPVAVEPSTAVQVDAAGDGAQVDGTAIFGDEQDVAATKAPALPLIGALVAVGLVIGVLVGIVAVVTAPVWTVAIGSFVAGNQGTTTYGTYTASGGSSGVDAAILLELPADADVVYVGYAQIDGLTHSSAQVLFDSDPVPLLEGAGYSESNDVPLDQLEEQGADFADPHFYVAFVGDTPFTALVGSTSDGRYSAALTGPVLSSD